MTRQQQVWVRQIIEGFLKPSKAAEARVAIAAYELTRTWGQPEQKKSPKRG